MTKIVWRSLYTNNEVISRLIAIGVELNAVDTDGETAFMHAVIRGHFYVVSQLIAAKSHYR